MLLLVIALTFLQSNR